jgi:hypothetical protein
MAHLWFGEHLPAIVDWTSGHAGRLQYRHPVLGGIRHQHRFHHALECRAVLHALLVGRKARVPAPYRVAQGLGAARQNGLAGGDWLREEANRKAGTTLGGSG